MIRAIRNVAFIAGLALIGTPSPAAAAGPMIRLPSCLECSQRIQNLFPLQLLVPERQPVDAYEQFRVACSEWSTYLAVCRGQCELASTPEAGLSLVRVLDALCNPLPSDPVTVGAPANKIGTGPQ